MFRKKLYTNLDEIQLDLDEYMKKYNFNRTNQGKRCKGRTPYETFTEGVEIYKKMVYESNVGAGATQRPLSDGQHIVEVSHEMEFDLH